MTNNKPNKSFLSVARLPGDDAYYNRTITSTTTTNPPNSITYTKPPPCRYFRTSQGCRYGDACNFSHDLDDVTLVLDTANNIGNTTSTTVTGGLCGICLQPFQGQLLCFLPQCDHVYCMNCLKNWRGGEMADYDRTKETAKSCPQCRVVSYFVVPCSVPPTSRQERDNLVQDYKERCAMKPCRYAENCPFGVACLFKHSQAQQLSLDVHMKYVVDDQGKTVVKSNTTGTFGEYLLQ
jgi:hypothetical protein